MGLFNKLINQSKKPDGLTGSIMLKIMNYAHSAMTNWALNKIEIDEDAVILDIGCGGGNTLKVLSKINKHGKLYGIDFSDTSIENTSRTNSEDIKTGKLILKKTSVSSIPFSENTFDIITAIQTHYFWPDLENDFREVYRILKHRGYFIIASEVYKIKYHMKHYKTIEELEKLYLKKGFTEVNSYEKKGWICVIGRK